MGGAAGPASCSKRRQRTLPLLPSPPPRAFSASGGAGGHATRAAGDACANTSFRLQLSGLAVLGENRDRRHRVVAGVVVVVAVAVVVAVESIGVLGRGLGAARASSEALGPLGPSGPASWEDAPSS